MSVGLLNASGMAPKDLSARAMAQIGPPPSVGVWTYQVCNFLSWIPSFASWLPLAFLTEPLLLVDEPAAPGFSNPTANTRGTHLPPPRASCCACTYLTTNLAGLPLSEDEPAFPNPSQNHQQRRNSKRLNARKGKASWVHSKRRALYRKAAKIASDITAASLPHSSQGYVGPTGSSEDAGAIQLEADGAPSEPFYGPLPSNVDPSSHPRLLNLARQGYRLIERSTG